MKPVASRQIVVSPISLLLKSTRFITLLVSVIVSAIILAIPALTPYRDILLLVLNSLAAILILGYSVSDAEHFGRDASQQPDQGIPSDIKELLDLILANQQAANPNAIASGRSTLPPS